MLMIAPDSIKTKIFLNQKKLARKLVRRAATRDMLAEALGFVVDWVGESVWLNPLTLQAGLACLGAQICLWIFFAYVLPPGPWRTEPGFTAHQVVCLPLLIYLTSVGWQTWLLPTAADSAASSTPVSRVLAMHPTGEKLAQVVMGAMLFWDIPCGLLIRSLREPLMLLHHVGMAYVAQAALWPIYCYYGVFFFGFIEVSGLPLVVVDLFHPKHAEWNALEQRVPLLSTINSAARLTFAFAFMLVRFCYFPYVVVAVAMPDMYEALALPLDSDQRRGMSDAALWGVCLCGLLFSVLQWYWGLLIMGQARKMLRGGDKVKEH